MTLLRDLLYTGLYLPVPMSHLSLIVGYLRCDVAHPNSLKSAHSLLHKDKQLTLDHKANKYFD